MAGRETDLPNTRIPGPADQRRGCFESARTNEGVSRLGGWATPAKECPFHLRHAIPLVNPVTEHRQNKQKLCGRTVAGEG